MQDIEARTLRLIGDPATRYREDPVRMLRAVRFAAKLDFTLADDTEAPIYELAPLLLQIPPARLFDEVLKLFMAGHGLMTFRLLSHYDLFGMLFPESEEAMADAAWAERLIEQGTDQYRQDVSLKAARYTRLLTGGFPVGTGGTSPAAARSEGMPPIPALQTAAQQVISRQLQHTSIPKRFGMPMRDIWELQARLAQRGGKRAFQTREHPRFRAAYDLLLLREQAGEIPGDWVNGGPPFRKGMSINSVGLLQKVGSDPADQGTGNKKKRKRRRKPKTDA